MSRQNLQTLNSTFSNLSYEQTIQEANICERCELFATRHNVVFCQGSTPCKIMVIGEAPGADEDAQGIPFVGRAGKLLTQMLLSIELNRPEDVYIANTLKCRPPNNREPKPSEIEACSGFLLRQIAQVKPQILVLLGAPAMRTILAPTETISKVRGKWFELDTDYQTATLKVMTLFHPSYLLRNASPEQGSPKWLTWQDLKLIRQEYNLL